MERKLTELKEYLVKQSSSVRETEYGYLYNSFSSLEEEFRLIKNGVGCYVMSAASILELKGKNVLDFLHRITTNDLKDLEKNSLRSTIFTNEKGRILDTATLINFEDYFLLLCNREKRNIINTWIDKYVIMDDVKCTIADERFISYALFGPQAEAFSVLICGKEIDEIPVNTIKVFSTDGINFFCGKVDSPLYPFNYLFIVNRDNSENLLKFMSENKGVFDFGLIGEEAYNSYRIEKQIPGTNELNTNYNPHEAKILSLVNFKKGCYIGQEVIARLDTYDKVQKYLTTFLINKNSTDKNNLLVNDKDGKEIGVITSISNISINDNYPATGYLRKQFIIKDAEYKLNSSNGKDDIVKVIG